MQRSVSGVAIALAWLLAASAQAASAAEFVLPAYRLVARTADHSTLILRRGASHYLYDTPSRRLLELLEPPEAEPQTGLLGETTGSTLVEPLWRRSAPKALEGMSEIEALARAAAEPRTRAMEPGVTPLESELRSLALTSNARLERRGGTLWVEARTPDELFDILERVSRRSRADSTDDLLAQCSWSACLSADSLSVTGSCGAETVEISTGGALGLSLLPGGLGAEIALSPEGITLRQTTGASVREITLALGP